MESFFSNTKQYRQTDNDITFNDIISLYAPICAMDTFRHGQMRHLCPSEKAKMGRYATP